MSGRPRSRFPLVLVMAGCSSTGMPAAFADRAGARDRVSRAIHAIRILAVRRPSPPRRPLDRPCRWPARGAAGGRGRRSGHRPARDICLGRRGSDSPWLPGAPLAVGAGEPLTVTFRSSAAVATWRPARSRRPRTDPPEHVLGEGRPAGVRGARSRAHGPSRSCGVRRRRRRRELLLAAGGHVTARASAGDARRRASVRSRRPADRRRRSRPALPRAASRP